MLKSLKECIQTLVTCVGGDGNLLLNVGPMPTGAIEGRQIERLREIGNWLKKNGESICGTRGGPISPKSWGVTTQKGTTVYVHVLAESAGSIALPKLNTAVKSAALIDGTTAEYDSTPLGTVLNLPVNGRDPYDTVVVLRFDKPPR